ncbi:immune inhibitor A domain-containing protein [Shewanella sp. Isolate11]|uniref:immune inhibitor A domain-containing protein n=1 Tax=Shewanella sp. Isolate11 TaxID=2908530 RepID=UPI001EFE19D5|nr:immune inhibitor A domain-containing protein [Shewanella sp. Isolate11]MCG9698391.1 immune inhibitor A [Shewanella sp. Isolate11]
MKMNTYYAGALTTLALAFPVTMAHATPSAPIASGPTADVGVINKEQILYWMTKRGELATDATEQQKQQAFERYTSKAGKIKLDARLQQAKLIKQQVSSKVLRSSSVVDKAQADAEVTKTVKVLGVLIDFPDLPHDNNRLSASDTAMYYSSYPLSHYQNLMFSTTGFSGPSGQTLLSGYQYYQAESGGSFFFTGSVKGWYTATQNAAYYGANNPNDADNDYRVPELVKEAVTAALADMTADEIATYDVEDPYDIDADGNLDEADGYIDHVMLFHSSIGEEAGGGVLGDDAIWSHQYYVMDGNNAGYTIPGTGMKVYTYTVQPIDAAAGVVAHEFGHDLGLPDEYDISGNSGDGSPVGSWSIMGGGSWTGMIPGSQPVGFSPYARSYLQDAYKGKWLNETVIDIDTLADSGQDVQLFEAVNNTKVNQISIPLPAADVAFKAPYSGSYQYYSGQGNLISTAAEFSLTLPASGSLSLRMKAHWNIEEDYDYAQVLLDGTPLLGNHTKASNVINAAENIITGGSQDIAGAEGTNAWVDLTFDVSAYAGGTHQIKLVYVTDEFVGDYGFVVDDIKLLADSSEVYSDDAETDGVMTFSGGFARITDQRPGGDRRYVVQLRSYNDVDVGLQTHYYDRGVLVWLENKDEADNNSSEHPGSGLIGVVDADQDLISNYDTTVQIRDAAFSLYDQTSYFGDNHLAGNPLFDDTEDYTAQAKPEAGVILPALGITMAVLTQAADSSSATLRFKYGSDSMSDSVTVSLSAQQDGARVSFNTTVTGGDGNYSYDWDFGVAGASSTETTPTYVYADAGQYQVTVTVTDGTGEASSDSLTVDVAIPPVASFSFTLTNLDVSFSNSSSAGVGALSYEWQFGDGNSSTAQSPSHSYTSSGTYTVVLTVTDTEANVSTVSQSVTVTSGIVSPPPPTESESDSSSGGSLAWWSLALLMSLAIRRRS